MHKRAQSGFSLIELLTVIALVSILASIAIPNMRDFIRNNRLTAAGNDLLRSMNLARTEAIKRQQGNAVVCATNDADGADAALTCSYGAFAGWFVFVDADGDWAHDAGEPVIEKHPRPDAGVTILSDNSGIISFAPTGFANPPGAGRVPTANIVLCDVRGNTALGANSTARAVFIANTGRTRVSRLYADVAVALGATGGACL